DAGGDPGPRGPGLRVCRAGGRLFPGAQLPRLWEAEPSHVGQHAGGLEDRAKRRERVCDGLRPVEGVETWRARMGKPMGTWQAGMAHRMHRDVSEVSWRVIRHPWWRTGPGFPAPRKRDGAVRGLYRESPLCASLAP